ncbi:hypothetical protein ACGFYZ_02530 [Streptomyces sp. NPDC048330]|uniref:hypothetical protein n=1 Tax=Streptomyces sp. NPDC048330 TaxID=3365533 RepID=UPI00371B85FE
MNGKKWAVGAAVAVMLLGVGGASAGGGTGAGPGAFGREAAQSEIRTAAAAAGLSESESLKREEAAASPSAGTERDRLAARAAACTAGWGYFGRVVDGARGKFDRTVAALAEKGWAESGKRFEEKIDDSGGTSVGVTLKKNGWTLYARHHAPKAMEMDVISFQATEDACMNGFSEREWDVLFGEDGDAGD